MGAVQMSTVDYAKLMPGEGPFGFFDPLGFMSQGDMTEGRARYYREVEVKHGRVAMLGALGFIVSRHVYSYHSTCQVGHWSCPPLTGWRAVPPTVWWQYQRPVVRRLPGDAAPDVLADGGGHHRRLRVLLNHLHRGLLRGQGVPSKR